MLTKFLKQKGMTTSLKIFNITPHICWSKACSTIATTPEKNDIQLVLVMFVFLRAEIAVTMTGELVKYGYYLEKTKKARQYTGSVVKCNEDNMSKLCIVCAWFQKSETTSCNKQVYALQTENVSHIFIPLNSICTLPFKNFESIETTVLNAIEGVLDVPHASKLASAKTFTLSNETVLTIEILYKMSVSGSTTITTEVTTNGDATTSNNILNYIDLTWIQYGSYRLTKHHKSLFCRL